MNVLNTEARSGNTESRNGSPGDGNRNTGDGNRNTGDGNRNQIGSKKSLNANSKNDDVAIESKKEAVAARIDSADGMATQSSVAPNTRTREDQNAEASEGYPEGHLEDADVELFNTLMSALSLCIPLFPLVQVIIHRHVCSISITFKYTVFTKPVPW